MEPPRALGDRVRPGRLGRAHRRLDLGIASTDEGDVGLTPANDLEILLFDNLFSPSGFDEGNWSITLEGLDPAVYDVFLYRAANVGVQTGLMSVNGVVAGNLAAAPTFPVAAVRGETFTSVFTVVGESGVLSIEGAGDGALSGLAGFQVVPAPEPTSAGGAVPAAGTPSGLWPGRSSGCTCTTTATWSTWPSLSPPG